MSNNEKIEILYFSDILCVWAYISQIRIDELKANFGDKVTINYHFNQIFGAVASKMRQNWGHRGGISAYAEHVKSVAEDFPNIEVHPDVWVTNTPTSSASCHVFLKAVHLLESLGELTSNSKDTIVETLAWKMRTAFFTQLIDVTKLENQLLLAREMDLPEDKILEMLHTGLAFAALEEDRQAADKHCIKVSPSIILNEGRQTLAGNVGYKVIEANVLELLDKPNDRASWC